METETIYLKKWKSSCPTYKLPTVKIRTKRRNWFCRKILRMEEFEEYFDIKGQPEFLPASVTVEPEEIDCKAWIKSVYEDNHGVPSAYKKTVIYKDENDNIIKLYGAFPIDIPAKSMIRTVKFSYDYYTVNEDGVEFEDTNGGAV